MSFKLSPLIVLLAAAPTLATDFRGLGPGPFINGVTIAVAVNHDGSVVIGSTYARPNGLSSRRLFRWTAQGGLEVLPSIVGESRAFARATNADGSNIVGFASDIESAFQWSSSEPVLQIPSLPGDHACDAIGISADASAIAVDSFGFERGHQAARWTVAGLVALDSSPDGESHAWDISSDGQVITGWSQTHAFRWTSASGMQPIVFESTPPSSFTSGMTLSADGSVIAGVAFINSLTADTEVVPFRWTAAQGAVPMAQLPDDLHTYPLSMSDDGRFVVGYSMSSTETQAFQQAVLWTPSLQVIDLQHYLTAQGIDLSGWLLTSADAISADGTTIVGNGFHNGTLEAWVATLPTCGTADFNTDGDSGTDADIEAFFNCLAGNCCPTCFHADADFDTDGDSGTDADIEAFFRVLAGGAC